MLLKRTRKFFGESAYLLEKRMEKRKLGNSGIEVSPLALGGNVFGWTVDEALAFKILDAFVEPAILQ